MSRGSDRPVYGIAMLDTRFPRLPGDIGNPNSFSGDVIYERVDHAFADAATASDGPAPDLLPRFRTALLALERRGAGILGTSCGFLAPFQVPLSETLSVPFVASSLWALPTLTRRHGGPGSVGVLTYSKERLGRSHFEAITTDTPPVEGLAADGHLATVIRDDLETLDRDAAERDAVQAARRLATDAGRPISAILLECTNLGPYRDAIGRQQGCRSTMPSGRWKTIES